MTGENVCHEDTALAYLFLKDNRKTQAIVEFTLALNLPQIVQGAGTKFSEENLFKIQQHDSYTELIGFDFKDHGHIRSTPCNDL